ncbi:MAG TPA: hypothetical protein VGI90_00700 [Steroidobacteraceae bacterium]
MTTASKSRRWRFPALLVFLIAGPGAAAQSPPQEFSADVVRRDADGSVIGPAAKLRVAGLKTRIDGAEASGGFFITDDEAGTALFVRPAQHIYMDARQSTPLTQIFVPVDLHDPCPQWQMAARIAGAPAGEGWRCALMGSTIIENRQALEYQVHSPGKPGSQRWIESGLGFPVKTRAEDGSTIALENIRIESQPASLFSIPSDYRKLDPQALIERVKHSDVWAEKEP